MEKKITIGPIDLKKINASLKVAVDKGVQAGLNLQAKTMWAKAAMETFPAAMAVYNLKHIPHLMAVKAAPIVIEKVVQCGFTQEKASLLFELVMENIRKRRIMRKFKRKGGKRQR